MNLELKVETISYNKDGKERHFDKFILVVDGLPIQIKVDDTGSMVLRSKLLKK